MKNLLILALSGLFLTACLFGADKGSSSVSSGTVEKVCRLLTDRYGSDAAMSIERGVSQAASLWRAEDGSEKDFETFCQENYVGDPAKKELLFRRLDEQFESLMGHFNKLSLDLKAPLHLDRGEIQPIDLILGQYEPSAHLSDDLFLNKAAFLIVLNFPYYTLTEKSTLGAGWNPLQWGYVRMGERFLARVPAHVNQLISDATTRADNYISGYNIPMGGLVTPKGKTLFPENLRLISHWGLRDELKGRYADPKGLEKQKTIYELMKRIITQEIPSRFIDSKGLRYDPLNNLLYDEKGGKIVFKVGEGAERYARFLEIVQAMKALDAYYPELPTHIARRFEADREIPEVQVEALFTKLLTSPAFAKTAKLIEKRLGRKVEPFDIWYDGFKSRSSLSEELLDKMVAEKFPNTTAFQNHIEKILLTLGFTPEQAAFIAPKIEVDPARGSGHAWGAGMRSEKAHLRTRVPAGGMNYKGFNIAMHELGHNVEQTISLHKVANYSLNGVPNTAFTEALAFVFQARDLDILGMAKKDPKGKDLNALDDYWAACEIAGVALVDMKVWHWAYEHPEATAESLQAETIKIAKEVWNRYYAPVFKVKDQTVLAIYSHMIDGALYLPDYPLGHIIAFQLQSYLEGKPLGPEVERIFSAGRIVPQQWMKNAVGEEISVEPLLKATETALKNQAIR